MALLDLDGDIADLLPSAATVPGPITATILTDKTSSGIEVPYATTYQRRLTSSLRDLVLAEDKTWHEWKEFGDFVHHCTCGAPEGHHNHLLALSKGTT